MFAKPLVQRTSPKMGKCGSGAARTA